jgi:hypothetical protein
MKNIRKHVIGIVIGTSLPVLLWAQVTGLTDDFNDNQLTGWEVSEEHQRTFELAEEDSVLKIAYHRTESSWEWDNFNFTPPAPLLVSANPAIFLRVRSDVSTQLTIKPVYTSGNNDWLQADIPDDNAWHTVAFLLENHGGSLMERIYMYLDGGSVVPSSGNVSFDDLRIGTDALFIHIFDLHAETVDTSRIDLRWSCNRPDIVNQYRIYRGDSTGFPCGPAFLAGTAAGQFFSDTGLSNNRTFYYRVTAVDTGGFESVPSPEISARTYQTNVPPDVDVESFNTQQVGLYEKLELILSLENASYTNPFDPAEIDIQARFLSPTGREWNVFGFYDNFESRNQWKVRFSPNEAGEWQVVLSATDINGTGESPAYLFTAVNTDYHGWLRTSPDNPHYLIHDDGTSFYGVGAYYPWGVTNSSTNGLGLLEASGANLFGYWNIMYGNEGNILESLQSGLGRYDQPRCGRIDALLQWAEIRNLKMMFAIWPHDLLSNTVWAHQWHQNPYNRICDVNEFYSSNTAWTYQEKQYRYIIARWGYSRSMGIWEIVNEVNGTDGWLTDPLGATNWVRKVHDYLTQNDPFRRPTTASKSGGQFWDEGYAQVDLPNVHLYETGWPARYLANPTRSSVHTYHSVSRQMWENFQKPGIMGEAGFTDNYGGYSPGSDEYLAVYHNALWTSWASGLASTPVWWELGSRQIMTNSVMEQMRMFSLFAARLDYAGGMWEPGEADAEGCDIYLMKDRDRAFGWLRETDGGDVSGKSVVFSNLPDTSYQIVWYNAWTGDTVETHIRVAQNQTLADNVPYLTVPRPDLVFSFRGAEEGDVPAKLELTASPIAIPNDSVSVSTLSCIIKDDQDRYCRQADNVITFSSEGPGFLLGDPQVQAQSGIAGIEFRSGYIDGAVRITAASPGLVSDTLILTVTNRFLVDDFERYTSLTHLNAFWRVMSGTDATLSLETQTAGEGVQDLRVSYTIGNGSPPYAGVFRYLYGDFTGARYLRFRLIPPGQDRDMIIVLNESGGRYWQFTYPLGTGDQERAVEISLTDFQSCDGAEEINLADLNEISFNIFRGRDDWGKGAFHLDDLTFLTASTTSVDEKESPFQPGMFYLFPVYPNPFNGSASVRYRLPDASPVHLAVYNMRGQEIAVLVDGNQTAGEYSVEWNAGDAASGVYLIRLIAGAGRSVQKCLLVR